MLRNRDDATRALMTIAATAMPTRNSLFNVQRRQIEVQHVHLHLRDCSRRSRGGLPVEIREGYHRKVELRVSGRTGTIGWGNKQLARRLSFGMVNAAAPQLRF